MKIERKKIMKTMNKITVLVLCICSLCTLPSCNSFLDYNEPQATLSLEQATDPQYVDNVIVSAYAIFISAEDINSSFSMWNFDVRSDDAYKGGNGTSDGDVFHQLEISKGILTTNWNINDMWVRLYNCLSRVNTAIDVLNNTDEADYKLKAQRLGEMYFLRAYGHFLLKRLYKNIPFVVKSNMTPDEYAELTNTTYTNDQGWQLIADDLENAYKVLPVSQEDKGRPTKAAAAALLAKVYLYKAYRQDNPASHQVTSINAEDLQKVIFYTNPSIYSEGGYALEADFHNNFRPEPQYENGVESIWAMQYSMNDGTKYGNLNWSYGLIVPNIPGVTDGGCDFYKPSQNLVNAFRTDDAGLPYIDNFNAKYYDKDSESADTRLFLTIGIPGLPYMFNPKYMMSTTSTWSRSNGLYGYYVSFKHNVDPDGGYLIKGSWWGSPMNRIVLRYADVMLMRAEAEAQLCVDLADAMKQVNELRSRASQSTGAINNYDLKYGVTMKVRPYPDVPGQEEVLKRVKMERRLELALESERFFDLVRWGEAKPVIQKYYDEEAKKCNIYEGATFTADKNEYLPIPHEQIAASNGHFRQNIGGW